MNETLKVIISAEIKELKDGIAKAKKEVESFAKGNKDARDRVKDDFKNIGESCQKGLAVAGGAIAAAGGALIAITENSKEYRAEQAKLVSAFEAAGSSADTAKNTYNDLYRVLGDGGQATEAAAHLAKLTTEEQALNEWTTICQGVYATFGDSLPIESLTEAANETAKTGALTGGLADALNWAGISEEDFQAKLDACNTEAEREQLIRETLNGTYSEAAAAYEKNAEDILKQNEAQAKLDESLAKVGEAIQPVLTAFAEMAATIADQVAPTFQNFMDQHGEKLTGTLTNIAEAIGKVIGWISDNWDVIAPVAGVVTAIAVALGVFSAAMGIVNTVMAMSPVTLIIMAIVAAIAALVAIIVVVIKHWDEIKEATRKAIDKIKEVVSKGIDAVVGFFQKIINWVKENWQGLLLLIVNPFAGAFKLAYDNCEGFRNKIDAFVTKVKNLFKNGFESAKNTILGIFDKIKSGITEKVESARSTISNIVEKLKKIFNFSWSLPKLKIPHISVSGGVAPYGIAGKGSLPKFSITWNALGGVFDSPAIFGYGDSFQGIGEDGAEAVVPLEKNLGWLDKLAGMLSDRMGGGSPIVLQVDGKTFAQISVDSINQLTKQTGSLPLQLA